MEHKDGEGSSTPEVTVEKEPQAPSQTKNERSEKEKAEFSLKKNAERLAELGGNPAEVLNIRPQIKLDEELSDDKPLTVGDFRKLQKEDAHKTALQLADELPETERDEVKTLLESRIVPSGNAEEDLRLARAAVNATHNAQIAELISNRTAPKKTAAGGSADIPAQTEFTPTPAELVFMKPPYNMTKEQILANRPK